MNKDVFSKKEFKDWAKDKLVLVEVDFPDKKQQSEAQNRHNVEVKDKYEIEGFPTLLVLDADGKKLGTLVGYDGKGAKSVIAKIENLLKKK